jgi:hypothetical protein
LFHGDRLNLDVYSTVRNVIAREKNGYFRREYGSWVNSAYVCQWIHMVRLREDRLFVSVLVELSLLNFLRSIEAKL